MMMNDDNDDDDDDDKHESVKLMFARSYSTKTVKSVITTSCVI